MIRNLVKACLFLLLPLSAQAQDLDSLMNMSAFTEESDLQKTLNQNLTVSSAKALTTRETPGIISLVTSEQIQNSGARDLIDVLRLVPGFDVAQDLSFIIGLGLRGSWANEGKVLVMMDGQPFNDLLYQGVALGNHFPVDFIERIEIIRGPGSAIYGGSAEYGVINIITKAADKQNGVHVFGSAGFHKNATGRTNVGVSIAQKSEDFDWDVALFSGDAIVSDGSFTELYGDTSNVDLGKHSYAKPLNLNIGLRVKNFKIRGMYDEFETNEPFTEVSFKNLFLDARYDFKINPKFTLTPQFKYMNQVPWQYRSTVDPEDVFEVRAQRYQASLIANYDVTRKINVNSGMIYFQDKATDRLATGYFQEKDNISFDNYAVFAEALFKHRLANATVGLRYEQNSAYGDAFVPRLALTKKIENFHFKILYSQAFRAPSIENINLRLEGEDIKPEKSQVFELELGYQFTPEMLLAINAFSQRTKNVIVYATSDIDPEGSYSNFPKTGSEGLELIYSVRQKNWYAHLTYSYSRAGTNSVDSYTVPGIDNQFVGLANHKLSLNTNFNLSSNLTFNPTFIYGGKRYAYTTLEGLDKNEDGEVDLDENGEEIWLPAISKLDPYLLVNAFLNYRNVVKGLTIGVGVYDLLNESPVIPQAYNGDYAPIPGRSREYILKVSYQLDFKK